MTIDLTDRESLQTSTGGVWNYISPSRINLWLRCGVSQGRISQKRREFKDSWEDFQGGNAAA